MHTAKIVIDNRRGTINILLSRTMWIFYALHFQKVRAQHPSPYYNTNKMAQFR